MARLFSSLLIIVFLPSCFSKRPDKVSLPSAKGQICEILVVVDSSLWNSPLGDTLKAIFSDAYPGLPQHEPYFDLDVVNPLELSTLQKQSRNIVFISVLDNVSQGNREILANFTNESIEIIEEDSSVFSFSKMNAYAECQQILHLFGQNMDVLMRNLSANKVHLRTMLLDAEKKRLVNLLFTNEQTELTQEIEMRFGFSLRVPQGYKTTRKNNGFLWLKLQDQEVDKNLFIAQKDYNSKEDFRPENILAWRQKITTQYLVDESGKAETIPSIQKIIPPIHKASNINGFYSIETRALWQTLNLSKGGTLISYTLVDHAAKKMIYLEAFISAPGKDKREYMLEMESVLRTVKEK